MYKTILASLAGVLIASGAMAQTGSLTAKLIDSLSRETIPGAVIEMALAKDTTKKQYHTSGVQGSISISGLAYGRYRMRVSFLGYATLERSVRINKAQTALGTLPMQQASQQIDKVVLEAYAIRTSQKGDTVVYNAGAFKVTGDADAETLLSKMPGITIVDGVVEAQGEEVKKVFVDGREFFGDDVNATIKNLPAEVIDKIETYNRLSDNAQFTGIDDGEGYKAINIVTKPSMRTGAFGKIYAGYGHKDKYVAGGSVNFFTGKHRLSLIGLANNLNQQNFSMQDILGVMGEGGGSRGGSSRSGGSGGSGSRGRGGSYYSSGVGNFMVSPQGGVSTVGSIGLNYSGQWREKVDFTGSYFFNETKSYHASDIQREYVPDNDRMRIDSTYNYHNSRNFNHRFNGKLDWKIDENNSFSARPNLSLQNYSNDAYSNSKRVSQSTTDLSEIIQRMVESASNSKNHGYNTSLELIWMHKFKKPGRTITVEPSGYFNLNDRESKYDNETVIFPEIASQRQEIPDRRNTIGNSYSYRLGGYVVYTEPLTAKSQLVLNYRGRYSYSDSDRKTYNYDFMNDLYETDYDINRSNVYNSGYLTHRMGPGVRYGGEKTVLVGNLYYQRAVLTKKQSLPPTAAPSASAAFDNFTYFGMMTHTFNPQNTLRAYLSSSTDNPSLTQLQNYLDESEPSNISEGNPKLVPTQEHRLSLTYNRSSAMKGRSFMASLSGSTTQNDIVNYTHFADENGSLVDINGQTIDKQPFCRYSSYRNVSGGSWSLRGGASFGTPVKYIKSNINFNFGATLSQSPSYIDTRKNLSKRQMLYTGATLGSNISENLDFSLSYNYNYNRIHNTIQSVNNRAGSNNRYWNQNASARLKWIFWKGFTLSGNSSFMQYTGVTTQYREDFFIVNLYLGKKLFKNQRGEINFGVNDMLNQNKSFSVTSQTDYVQRTTSNVIPRYYSIQFTYNLRTFKGRAPQEERPQFREGEGGMRIMGPDFGPSGPRPERGGGYRGPGGGTIIRP